MSLKNLSQTQKPKKMLQSHKKYFSMELGKLALCFSANVTKEQLEVYWEVLSEELTFDQFQFSCSKLKNEFKCEYGIKFPVPAHFIDIHKVEELTSEETFDANYLEIQSKIRKGITVLSQSGIQDADFLEVLKTQGGLYNLRQWTQDDWKYSRGRLKDMYIAKKKSEEAEILSIPDMMKDVTGMLANKLSIPSGV